jgi:RNA-directed DNA polymerase
MLDALDNGVKGGKWFSLRDKLYAPANLAAAWAKVRRNRGAAGVDGQSIARYEAQADRYLNELHHALKSGNYEPQPVRRRWIPKPGTTEERPLGIPTVKDRIVQTALRHVLEPIWEKMFRAQSYGFRPGRGCKDALRRVDELLKSGHVWVVDADIQSFFDTIDHGVLLSEIERTVTATNLQKGRIMELGNRLFAQSSEDGALPTVHAATAPDVAGGDYFGPGGLFEMTGPPKKVRPSARGTDPESARRVWELSARLTGVTYP